MGPWLPFLPVTALGSIHGAVAGALVILEAENIRTLLPFWTLSDKQCWHRDLIQLVYSSMSILSFNFNFKLLGPISNHVLKKNYIHSLVIK